MTTHTTQVLIIGGGTAGISVAARLREAAPNLEVTLVDPAEHHDYQPLWTLVGAGVFPRAQSRRTMAEVIPAGVRWVKERAVSFEPTQRAVVLEGGDRWEYEQLVVAMGIQLDWDKIEGLKGNLGKHNICSNYAWETVESTWENFQRFKGGDAIFTIPPMPIKCAGAPQKIMWLFEDYVRKHGLRRQTRVHIYSAGAVIFGVEKYRKALERLIEQREVITHFKQNLVAVNAAKQEATFEHVETKQREVVGFDLLHISPPQSAPDVLKQSPLAGAGGWVEVDKHTMQHVRYPDVWSLGDCSSLPTSRTGAVIRKEAPILVENLLAARRGEPLPGRYDGYASCPLVTGYGRVILAEFDYDGKPAESFPFDQSQERYSMYMLKAYGLPEMYWNGMLKGRM
jgi:sulfide:quinone oxidoreductase